jgi:CTP:molybdopterin cytidylyltransferase MocA
MQAVILAAGMGKRLGAVFCQILIERNVMASGEGKFVSLAVRSREDNDKLLKVLSAL